jgi:hypothetical protein
MSDMTETVDIRNESGPRERPPVSDFALWVSVLGGPFVFLLNLEVSYVMMDWACYTGNDWAMHLVNAVALVLAAATAALGLSTWARVGREWPDSGGSAASRSRLMATVGTMSGTLSAVSVLAQWITVMVLGTCLRA